MANLVAPYDLETMTLLVTMKKYIANANPGHYNLELQDLIVTRLQLLQQLLNWPNGQPFDLKHLSRISGSLSRVKARIAQLERIVSDQTHIAERIETLFVVHHLLVATLLEVYDADSADFVKRMRDRFGWPGTACFDRALGAHVRADIVQHLDNVPYRVFQRSAEAGVFFE